MEPFVVSECDVRTVISSLNINKSCGPDGISNRMLKMSLSNICEPLAYIFNSSIRAGIFPADWKKANVTPVFKKGDRQSVANYRPISLLCNVSKVFERIIYNKLYYYLMSNALLTPRNSGYKKGESTVQQLLQICHKIYQGLEENKDIRMVFLDASKAFDRVWHDGLTYKLHQLGIEDPLLSLLSDYIWEENSVL